MSEEKSFDLAISLDSIKLVDTFFHLNPTSRDKLRSQLSLSVPLKKIQRDDKSQRLSLHSAVSIRYMLVEENPTNADLSDGQIPPSLSFGVALNVTVGTSFLSNTIFLGKHSSWSSTDFKAERDKRMAQSLLLEALKAGYSFASTRLIEVSSLSPMGSLTLPLPDYDEILKDIEKNDQSWFEW